LCETVVLDGTDVIGWEDEVANWGWAEFGANHPNRVTDADGDLAVDFTPPDLLINHDLPGSHPRESGEFWCVCALDQARNIICAFNDEGVISSYHMYFGTYDGLDGLPHIFMEADTNFNHFRSFVWSVDSFALGEKVVLRWVGNGTIWKLYINNVLQTLNIELGSNTGDWLTDISGFNNAWFGRGDTRYDTNDLDGRLYRWVYFQTPLTDQAASDFYDLVITTVGSPCDPTGDDLWIDDGEADPAQGVNPAHAYHQLLTRPFPHGAGQDPIEVRDLFDGESLATELFDQTSLCAWAAEAVTDELPASVLAPNGEYAGDVLAQIMQDHGVFLAWNPAEGCGKFIFKRIRQETPIGLPAEMNVGELPEVETQLLEQVFDKIMYTYPDRNRFYKETVITIDEDSQASYLEVQRAQKAPLFTVVDARVARKVVERKSQEDLPGAAGIQLRLNRNARLLVCGTPIKIDQIQSDITYRLRVAEVQIDQLSQEVLVTCVTDQYGADTAPFTGEEDNPVGAEAGAPPEEDLAATFMEVPLVLMDSNIPRIIVPRIRESAQILGANIYVSPTGASYEFTEDVAGHAAGGTLDAEILSTDAWEITTGPTITILGPDTGDFQDLSADEAGWRAGKQLVVIDDEILFVKKLTAIDTDTYRLDGLLRARYGTSRAAHSIGDVVYVFAPADLAQVFHPLVSTPGQSLYVKPQPHTLRAVVPIGDVNAINKTIYGHGIVPDPIDALRITAPGVGVDAYAAGNDVSFGWAYSSRGVLGTGAGAQGAGLAVGTSPIYGTFELRFLTTGDVLKRTVSNGTTTSYTYVAATRNADFGGDVDFKVEVYNINGGYRSSVVTKTIVKV
jgi:hypothetical protein